MIGLILRIVVWVFAAIVIFGAAAFLAVEAMDKAESIQKRAPWIPKILERRDAFVALLLIGVVLLVGDGYELLTKEMPEVPSLPTIVFKAPVVPAIVAPPAPLSRRESANSLRHRVWRLADQIDQFWTVKRKGAPFPGEDQQPQKMQKWQMVSDRECNDKFKGKILDLVQEVGAKGVNIKIHGWLDYSAILVQNQRCLLGDELEAFRELGFHLDANDNKIDIKF